MIGGQAGITARLYALSDGRRKAVPATDGCSAWTDSRALLVRCWRHIPTLQLVQIATAGRSR